MYEPHVEEALASLKPSDLVLDVGGWACPFNRAQWVLDSEPYETRGFYRTFGGPASQAGDEEWFNRDRWIQMDICDRRPWPFADKQFDMAICSHVLEDIRDPLWVCSELQRVAKRGYIETPSRLQESCRGLEEPRIVGLSHHRWFVEYGENSIRFLMKFHFIHDSFLYSLPRKYSERLCAEQRIGWLWWTESFTTEELFIHGAAAQREESERYVAAHHAYPRWRVSLDRARQHAVRIRRGLNRRFRALRG